MEKLFEKYLKEENSSINTNIFSSYKKEYLSNRKKSRTTIRKRYDIMGNEKQN